jgi:putative ABC transport system substrate-binding protein
MRDLSRRGVIGLVGGAAARPVVARAQQTMPVLGFLSALGRNDRPNLTDAFRRSLAEAGYVEGRNVTIEYRFADNQHSRLSMLVAELLDRKAAVIIAAGGGTAVLAAKAATTTVPIVFLTGGDPTRKVSSAALIGLAATSPESVGLVLSLPRRRLDYCMNLSPAPP